MDKIKTKSRKSSKTRKTIKKKTIKNPFSEGGLYDIRVEPPKTKEIISLHPGGKLQGGKRRKKRKTMRRRKPIKKSKTRKSRRR
jgi:hypothetical protein